MAKVYGSSLITINSPPITSEFEYVMLLSGLTTIIVGAQLEINSHKKLPMDSESKISDLQDKINKLEKSFSQ